MNAQVAKAAANLVLAVQNLDEQDARALGVYAVDLERDCPEFAAWLSNLSSAVLAVHRGETVDFPSPPVGFGSKTCARNLLAANAVIQGASVMGGRVLDFACQANTLFASEAAVRLAQKNIAQNN